MERDDIIVSNDPADRLSMHDTVLKKNDFVR